MPVNRQPIFLALLQKKLPYRPFVCLRVFRSSSWSVRAVYRDIYTSRLSSRPSKQNLSLCRGSLERCRSPGKIETNYYGVNILFKIPSPILSLYILWFLMPNKRRKPLFLPRFSDRIHENSNYYV